LQAECCDYAEDVAPPGNHVVNPAVIYVGLMFSCHGKIQPESLSIYSLSLEKKKRRRKKMRPLSKTTSGLFLFGLENSFTQQQLIQLFNHMGNINTLYI